MDRKALVELLRYSFPHSILVVRWDGRLVEVYCPFQVKVRKAIDGFVKGKDQWVTRVLVSTEGKVVFKVVGKPCYYWHFDILI